MSSQNFERNLDSLIRRVERARLAYGAHHVVQIVAASKYVGASEIEALYAAGQRAFGENKVQDLSAKCASLAHLPIEWHFIGKLQKNKINALIALRPSLFHGLDSMELALALNERLSAANARMKCLLEVNASGESSKGGVEKNRAVELYLEIVENCPNIALSGIMSMGANVDFSVAQNRKIIAQNFADTKEIFDALAAKISGVKFLSMGMSSDFELAIQHGANLIRPGSALFNR